MDWDDKPPSWDLGTVVGPSGAGAGAGALDLKLGGPTNWKAAAAVVPAAVPAPAKRQRAGQAAGVPACSVEGCTADLSKCREYHRRHKVCEAHSKTPVVTVAGQQQRFCQQCSRFQLLSEFDEVKRSCRKRLDGHNRRRRKPQPDQLNSVSLFANHHGTTRFASYPQMFSTSSMTEPKWPASAVKTETDTFHGQYCSPLHLNGATTVFDSKERKHFPFLMDHSDAATAAVFNCQPFTITPSSESSSSRHSSRKVFARGGGLDTCALSLLSDNPTPTPMMIPTAQPLSVGLQFDNLMQMPDDGDVSLTGLSYVRMEGKDSGGSVLAAATHHSSAAAAAQLQYQSFYQVNADQSTSDGAVQALHFTW